ncbi:unnamed protein product [Didymodactylos carnosus]|uniref:Uncharacterized protein n=1 Tax=Didymodactylos carnosus TaxID=1234261 RepID=A0A814ZNV4_9BILA|nr:unnamed protein product [Didymodactylos carnosus]CAF4009983.1 unnamed protein product [Didymodactylos carnosus]
MPIPAATHARKRSMTLLKRTVIVLNVLRATSVPYIVLTYMNAIGIAVIDDYRSIPPLASTLESVISLIKCGISSGVINKNYTLVGHWSYSIVKYFLSDLNKSHNETEYCMQSSTTVSPKLSK